MNSNSDNLGFDFIKPTKTYKPKTKKKFSKNNSEKALNFSKKIIAALEDKLKKHNDQFDKKVSLFDLKKAYKIGFSSIKDINKEALAQVNVLLRALSEGNIFSNFKSSAFEILAGEFVVKGTLVPEEVDYKKAEQDIKDYDLNDFDFKSHEELYLEDEEDRVTYTIE
jgi:hypothetical protein